MMSAPDRASRIAISRPIPRELPEMTAYLLIKLDSPIQFFPGVSRFREKIHIHRQIKYGAAFNVDTAGSTILKPL